MGYRFLQDNVRPGGERQLQILQFRAAWRRFAQDYSALVESP